MRVSCRAALAAKLALAAVLLPQASFAADPQAVADSLVAALAAGTEGSVTIGEARAEGDDVVITGLSFSGPEGESKVVFSRTLVVAPEERSAGGFQAEQMEMTGGTLSGEATGTIESATATSVTVLGADEIAAQGLTQGVLYETVNVTGISVNLEDQPGEMKIERVEVNAGSVVDNVPQASSGVAEGITIPASVFGEGPMTPQALGYETLELEISWEGARDPATNELVVEDFTLTMLDGGSLNLSGRIGNVPFAEIDDPTASAETAGQITVHNVRLRYVDQSLARRILDTVAKTQGMTGEQYAEQLAAAMPFLLVAINNPAFQQQVANAVGAFLKDPRSLTIEVAPQQPVSGTEIMEIVDTAPQTLPDRLNASVSANDAQ